MKVRLVDNTTKTILINDTAKVQVIRDTIGRKIGIPSCEEYGLKVVGSGISFSMLRHLSSPNLLDDWLSLNSGLYEQDVKEEDIILFDKNYFFFDVRLFSLISDLTFRTPLIAPIPFSFT